MREETALTAHPQVSDILWGQGALPLRFRVRADGVVELIGVGQTTDGFEDDGPGLPLAEIRVTGAGGNWSGERSVETAVGARLIYRSHAESSHGGWEHLRVDLADPVTGLRAEVHYDAVPGIPAVRSWTRLINDGPADLVIEAVTALLLPSLGRAQTAGIDAPAGIDVHWAASDWLAEGRWQSAPLRTLLPNLSRRAHEHGPRGCFARSSQGTWSTGRYLPGGVLTWDGGTRALAWQIESSSGWRWEVGEHDTGGGQTGAYLALLGPGDREHQWRETLRPGDDFTTVTAAVTLGEAGHGSDGLSAALGALTRYRRAIRRPHPDHVALPVIFNDYMNTLMGDPTTQQLLPLVDAAARAGAETFVIDAGWYDDDAEGWWDSVGEWRESSSRFPGGLAEVCDAIRAAGMTPGLWLEPEVVGVRSRVAEQLPPEAFFQRHGVRITEHGRHHLDLRHPAARAHLDSVVDRLVADYGVGYFKLDYNINPGPGTDVAADASPGSGLLGHQRAYLAWLSDVLDRHPALTVENCASGAMRADYALLSQAQLQSTSDQQDPLRYPPIAAAAPASIAPEQAAVWAYPQPDFTDEEIAFTVAGALLGRVHLSGHLDRMSPSQLQLVAEGVAAYKSLRPDLATSTPFWPLGHPGWEDDWLCLGLRGTTATYLLVWRRAGTGEAVLPVPHLTGLKAAPRVLYPTQLPTRLDWHSADGRLHVELPADAPGARLILLEQHQ